MFTTKLVSEGFQSPTITESRANVALC